MTEPKWCVRACLQEFLRCSALPPSLRDANAGERRMQRQRRLYTSFCNAKLSDRDDVPPVTDIFEDMKDGRLLYALLEELSGQSLASLGRVKSKGKGGKPMTRIDHVANLSISFRYIKQTSKVVGIGPGDIADGNPGLILGLLWSIIVFFQAKDLGGIDDVSSLKKKILKWAQKRTENNEDVEVRNLKDSFMGGRAFLAILNDVDPSFEYAPTDRPCDNFKAAFSEAAERYRVPELLDGEDEDCWKDEQAMVTYLSEMMKRLPERAEDLSPGVLRHVDDTFDRTIEDLKAICAVPSVPENNEEGCVRCANVIADIMRRDGLDKVEVVAVEGGAPFVAASGGKFDKALPTLLLVGDYGVEDPANMAWTADPFAPTLLQETSRLQAAGAVTKAGAIGPLKALASLTAALPQAEKLSVNLEVLLACGRPEDYAPGGRVEKFIAAKYGGERPEPHYAIVDAPSAAASVAPEKFATVFACRGEAAVKVTVTVAENPNAPDTLAGPLLDANLALATVAAGLRKTDTALPNVTGLVGFPEPNKFTKAVSNVNHVEARQLAATAKYPARHRLATLPGSKWSVVEQLCFHPSVVVCDLAAGDRDGNFPGVSSTMTVFANLAPAFAHDGALAALSEAIQAKAPWDSRIQVRPVENGRTGFLTDISPQFLSKLTDAAKKRFDKRRGAALAASPAYLPLVAAVARALPRTATYGAGFDDQAANLARAQEATHVDDLKATIKTFVTLVFDLKGLTKQQYGKVDAGDVYVAVDA